MEAEKKVEGGRANNGAQVIVLGVSCLVLLLGLLTATTLAVRNARAVRECEEKQRQSKEGTISIFHGEPISQAESFFLLDRLDEHALRYFID